MTLRLYPGHATTKLAHVVWQMGCRGRITVVAIGYWIDMRIAVVAPPWIPVPPPSYGGTELMIGYLAEGLQRAGHEVLLVAHLPVPLLRSSSTA